jgi:hypothetical protein
LTRDFFWATLTLFAIRRFVREVRMQPTLRQQGAAHGKGLSSTLAALTLVILILLGCPSLSFSQLPLSTGAPYVGQKAPDFTLPDQHGKPVSLHGLLKSARAGKLNGLVLIFYRGYW